MSSFSKEYTGYDGGGINGRCTLLKNVALHFHTGSLKINICKVRFWEGGREGVTKKSTLCTLLIMLTILDDLLPSNDLSNFGNFCVSFTLSIHLDN